MDRVKNKLQPRGYSLGIEESYFELRALGTRIARWGLIVAEFGAVQVLVQALLAIAGLLVVRSLPKEEYALFVIANSMQMTCNLLADLGIAIGVRSIGGQVWNDRFRFGQLLNTALHLRGRFALVSFAFCIPITAWMLLQSGATTAGVLVLCIAVAAGTIPLLKSSIWSVSPILHCEYRPIQQLDLTNAALRLFLLGVLSFSWITAWLAAFVGVATNYIQAAVLRRLAKSKADFLAPLNNDDKRELLRLSKKSIPNTLFFCFQGQVTLFILSFLGSPSGIADFTALGRIGALFSIISISFENLVAPRFARCQERNRLAGLYCLFVAGTALMLFPVTTLIYLLPGPFLWLLGDKYTGLENECLWVVAAAYVAQLGAAMWNLNISKAWIRVHAIAFIPAILGVQMLALFVLDLRNFNHLLILNLLTAAAPIPVYVLDAILGFRALKGITFKG